MSSSTGATATAIHSLLHLQSQVSGAHASCQAAKPRFCGSELLRKHPRRSWRSYSLDPGCKTLALRDIRHIQTSCLWFGLVSQLAAKTLCISLDDFVLQTINFGTKISQNPDASPGFDELSTCHILPPPNHSPVLRSGRSAANRPASWRGEVTELILSALLHRHPVHWTKKPWYVACFQSAVLKASLRVCLILFQGEPRCLDDRLRLPLK